MLDQIGLKQNLAPGMMTRGRHSLRAAFSFKLLLTLFFSLLHSHVHAAVQAPFGLADEQLAACVNKLAKKRGWQNAQDVTQVVCHNKKIESSQGIEQFPNLKKLSLYKNKLRTLDLSNFKHLEHLNVAGNQLTNLTLHRHSKLELLYAFHNPIKQLNIEGTPQLSIVKANNGQLTHVTLRDTPALTKLYLFDNQLEIIDIEALTQLRYLDVRHNPMPDEFYDYLDGLRNLTSLHDGNAEDWQ